MTSKYYVIPIASIPQSPSYKVWFATWSTAQPTAYWSETRPDIKPDGKSTWAVGVVKHDGLLQDATPLGDGGKDLPPPPLEIVPSDGGMLGFQKAFAAWLNIRDLPS